MFFQQLINGLTTGSVYALIALGYTMIYGILGLINFAQGEIYMCGAFVAVLLLATGKVNFFLAFPLGMGRPPSWACSWRGWLSGPCGVSIPWCPSSAPSAPPSFSRAWPCSCSVP